MTQTQESRQYPNPRAVAEFTDWPHGSRRTTCTFRVESDPKHGQRIARVTIDPKTGRPSKPKTTTYGRRAAIADGNDGRIYITTLTIYGSLSITQSNLDFSAEHIHPHDPRHAPLLTAMCAIA